MHVFKTFKRYCQYISLLHLTRSVIPFSMLEHIPDVSYALNT